MNLVGPPGGHDVGSKDVVRQVLAPGVTRADLTVAANKVAGSLFLPPTGMTRGRPVLVFTGSDGTIPVLDAALLAAHGHPALAIGYFHQPGLPATLLEVPLEYGVGTVPYAPGNVNGATREADAAAHADGWPKVLAWLSSGSLSVTN